MATLESDKVDRALTSKLKATHQDSGDWYYLVRNDRGIIVATTSISKGAKHTLGHNRVSQMARQLRLNKPQLLAGTSGGAGKRTGSKEAATQRRTVNRIVALVAILLALFLLVVTLAYVVPSATVTVTLAAKNYTAAVTLSAKPSFIDWLPFLASRIDVNFVAG